MAIKGDKVVIGFEADFAEEMEKFKAARNAMAVNHVLGQMLGRQVTAEFVAAGGLMAGVPGTGTGTGSGREKRDGFEEAAPEGKAGKRKSKHEIVNDDAVVKAVETFNGSIVEIRE